MFLNENVLNSLMKKAYKTTGLRIAQLKEGWLTIAGGYWQAEVNKEFVPNKTLGNIISLVGDLPKLGERFCVTKDEKAEITSDQLQEIDARIFNEGSLTVTDTMQIGTRGTIQRFLQDEDTGNIFLVNNVYIDIVSKSLIDEDKGEYEPGEPVYNHIEGILYQNNVCKLRAYFRNDIKNNKIMENIKGIDLIPEIMQ